MEFNLILALTAYIPKSQHVQQSIFINLFSSEKNYEISPMKISSFLSHVYPNSRKNKHLTLEATLTLTLSVYELLYYMLGLGI